MSICQKIINKNQNLFKPAKPVEFVTPKVIQSVLHESLGCLSEDECGNKTASNNQATYNKTLKNKFDRIIN